MGPNGSRADLELPHEQIDRVMDAYGLGAVEEVRLVAEGLMNRNWRVVAEGRAFAVKQVLDVKPEQARFQHQVTIELARDGIALPAPLPTRSGETLAQVRDAVFAVHPWVDGRGVAALEWSARQCAQAGTTLGRIHLALARVLPAACAPRRPTVPRTETALREVDRYLTLIAQNDGAEDFDRVAVDRLHQRRRLLAAMAHLRPEEGRWLEPAGYVHGDYHDLNLLWEGEDVVAVLDWDRMRVRAWAEELVRSATLMFGNRAGDGGLDVERAAAFSTAYRHQTGVGPEQIDAAVERLWWERMCDLWHLQWHYERGDHSCDHLFLSAAALLEWWSHNRDAVRAALSST